MIKDKIKEIEEKYDMWADDYNLDPQEVEWLIEQVKRVQGLEKCLGELIKQNKEMRKSVGFYNSETYNAHLERLLDKREKQIQDLIIDVEFHKEASERYEYVEQQNKRYREALKFYADEENYKPFDGIFLSSYQNKVDEDGGEVAQKALEESE